MRTPLCYSVPAPLRKASGNPGFAQEVMASRGGRQSSGSDADLTANLGETDSSHGSGHAAARPGPPGGSARCSRIGLFNNPNSRRVTAFTFNPQWNAV